MNYLTHYLIDHQPDAPHFNFGLALPDLVNISQRGWKPVQDHKLEQNSPKVASIWSGYQKHINRDAHFHNTELFNVHTRRLRKELEKFNLKQEGTRLFFVAHVLLEIMIDRHIVKTRRAIPDQFYLDMAAISDSEIEDFFRLAGSETPPRFLEFFGKFKESKYLYGYAEDNGIYYSINRLLHRTHQPTYETEAQNRAFNNLIMQVEEEMFGEIETFLSNKTI